MADFLKSLHLKSAVATSLAAAQSVPNAVLCTNDQTFELRQVQSSNVLYILRTSGIETEGKSSLSAAAECQGLLELVPGKEDVVQHLRTLIPVRDAKTASKIEGMAPKCRRLLIDMPFSEQEVASGREELCVCEEQGFCWIPTAKTLKDTWLSIMTATVLNGSSVDKDVDVDRVRQLVVEDGCNTAVFDAILRRNSRWTKSPNRLAFTADRSIAWLGTVLLEANEDSPVKTEQFIAQWKDQLPEAWRAKANLNLLQVRFREQFWPTHMLIYARANSSVREKVRSCIWILHSRIARQRQVPSY